MLRQGRGTACHTPPTAQIGVVVCGKARCPFCPHRGSTSACQIDKLTDFFFIFSFLNSANLILYHKLPSSTSFCCWCRSPIIQEIVFLSLKAKVCWSNRIKLQLPWMKSHKSILLNVVGLFPHTSVLFAANLADILHSW